LLLPIEKRVKQKNRTMKKIIILASIVVALVFLAILFWPKKVERKQPDIIPEDSLITADSLRDGISMLH
jgi:hypothetical protein